jgi:hypothetical protein
LIFDIPEQFFQIIQFLIDEVDVLDIVKDIVLIFIHSLDETIRDGAIVVIVLRTVPIV